jgi:uncharacterized ubiquitin-like protein YukD
MQTVFITLVSPVRRVDLKLPAEVPVGELLPRLLDLGEIRQPLPQQWRLVILASRLAVPPNRTLHDFGVVDGQILSLLDNASFQLFQQHAPVQPFRPQVISPDASTGGIGVKWNLPGR